VHESKSKRELNTRELNSERQRASWSDFGIVMCQISLYVEAEGEGGEKERGREVGREGGREGEGDREAYHPS